MNTVVLWLAGDVMTGRGIDQIQAQALAPRLYESVVRDARDYVRLAERRNGPVPTPVEPAYIWGDALAEIDRRQPAVRLVNLETAITTSDEAWPGKGVHYRMHPANVSCLKAARIDACALANNHVLDWGQTGLDQTLYHLKRTGIQGAGAGLSRDAAQVPAVIPLPGGGRLLVFSWAACDCGVPPAWAATRRHAGVAMLSDLGEATARDVVGHIASRRQPGDRVVISLHWGSNWGLEVPPAHRLFAQRLIDLGAVDLVHGHSSHHPRPIEVYRGRLILYGCGDLINDYEGIELGDRFDASAVCLYFAYMSLSDGTLQGLEIVPMQLCRLRLSKAASASRDRLQLLLNSANQGWGTAVQAESNQSWRLRW